jgi:hypothetical protein
MKMYQSDNKSKRHAINHSVTAPRGTAALGHTLLSTISSSKHQQKERRERKWEVLRGTTFGGRGQETVSPVLKAPRQCPLVLLVELMHMMEINVLYDV